MDPTVEEHEIVIVGGGIAGLATALALTRLGIPSRVLERSPELRAKGAALSLYPNAWFALKALGVDHKLTSVYDTWKKLIFKNLDTGTTQEFNFADSKYRKEAIIRTVHRKALLKALAEDLPPNTVRFSSKLVSIKSETQEDSSTATLLHLEDGTVIRAKVVIGCDGVHSPVAQWLGLPKPMDAGQTAVRGVSVFPEGHRLEMDMRHYVNGSIRGAFVPLSSTDIYWFVSERTSNYSGMNLPTSPDLILKEVTTNLVNDFPSEFLNVTKNTDLSTLTWHPVIFRAPWSVAAARANTTSVTIAGDAMHPMTPDVGQGGCSALEDAVILARCLSQARSGITHWPQAALQKYVGQRRWRAAWIVSCAWYVSWVQHGGGTGKEWWSGAARWFRDRVFYNIIPLIALSLRFDCGELTAAK